MSVSVLTVASALNAVSLSPDATLAAVGGRDGKMLHGEWPHAADQALLVVRLASVEGREGRKQRNHRRLQHPGVLQ